MHSISHSKSYLKPFPFSLRLHQHLNGIQNTLKEKASRTNLDLTPVPSKIVATREKGKRSIKSKLDLRSTKEPSRLAKFLQDKIKKLNNECYQQCKVMEYSRRLSLTCYGSRIESKSQCNWDKEIETMI
jgi:hypothetical protein